MIRVNISDNVFFCFVHLVSLAYSFHDSSYIKRQISSDGGHKFPEFACLDCLRREN